MSERDQRYKQSEKKKAMGDREETNPQDFIKEIRVINTGVRDAMREMFQLLRGMSQQVLIGPFKMMLKASIWVEEKLQLVVKKLQLMVGELQLIP